MAYIIQTLVGFSQVFLWDPNAYVACGRGFEEGPRHVVDHDDIGPHCLVGPHSGGLMDEEPKCLQGRVPRKRAAHVLIVELLPNEAAAIDRARIIALVDVYPAGLDYIPFVPHRLGTWDVVVHSIIPEVGDILRASFDYHASVELHARKVVPSKGRRYVALLVIVRSGPACSGATPPPPPISPRGP